MKPRAALPFAAIAVLLLGPTAPAASQALANHDSNAPVDVDADRLEVQDRQDRAVFSGNVRVRQGGLNLDAGRLTVVYAGDPGSGLQVQRPKIVRTGSGM